MTPEYVLNVEGSGVEALADRDHLRRRHEQEHRVRIDESPDQPGAGDAVDLGPSAGHPDGATLRIAGWQLRGGHQRKLGRFPVLETAFERFGFATGLPNPGGGTLGELCAAQAYDDGGLIGEFAGPLGGLLVTAPDGAGNQPRVSGKILLGTYVDQHRGLRRADQTGKFIRRYFGK